MPFNLGSTTVSTEANTRGRAGHEGPDADVCQWGGDADAVLTLNARPRPNQPWAALVAYTSQQARDLASTVKGSFTMHAVHALGADAVAFYSDSVSADDPTYGASDTTLMWLDGDVLLHLGFIGKPSLPDQTTMLLPLAQQISAAAAAAAPTFVP